MRQCLTSPEGGYYTAAHHGRDQFGQKGDFITSPEISQIFGELVGLWIVSEWLLQGKKRGVELMELGPGRGTLMDDMLRTIRNFKPLASSIEAVYMVEASPSLRDAQRSLLCGDSPVEDIENGIRSTSKYFNVPLIWYEDIKFVPKHVDKSPFIVAHEFFDALPIHAFQSISAPPPPPQRNDTQSSKPGSSSSSPQWRELLVARNSPLLDVTPQSASGSVHEFQLSLSSSPSRHSTMLPEISERYKKLKLQENSIIEVCPEGQSYAEDLARRIGGGNEPRGSKFSALGAALILDYGPAETVPVNSLRGIRAHKSVSPFSSPGMVDLSADVDFAALAEAALRASPTVEVYGPVEQGTFLHAMGIKERAQQLLKTAKTEDEEKKKRLESGWKRLVERGGGAMGKVYKAMAIVPASGGKRRPVGFGGEL
ncbi:MAG: hypothetical protein M1833_001934 [Piccolia ochrophora]|nr:MAG: hypothetical protein M1833_001934 [Piccolia ochrophora]